MKKKLKIMVVDDDRWMVKTICDILRIKGYATQKAFSGEEAVERVKRGCPACVLMDLKMQGIDGVEALHRIKAVSPDLPVVLMSAFATEEQEAEARRQGAYTVFTKPIDLKLLLSFLALLRKEESILVVDDDPDFCRTMRDILQDKGYRVETEMDGANVLDRMESDYKLAVLLDLKLGEVDGLDVLTKIRARYPSKPVILVTGYGEALATSIARGEKIGAYTSLYKPFLVESLLAIIEEISRGKKQSLLGEPFTDHHISQG